jgi:hypothetical protein
MKEGCGGLGKMKKGHIRKIGSRRWSGRWRGEDEGLLVDAAPIVPNPRSMWHAQCRARERKHRELAFLRANGGAVRRDDAVWCGPDAHGGGAGAKELITAYSSRNAEDGRPIMNVTFFVYWIVTEGSRGKDHEVVSLGACGRLFQIPTVFLSMYCRR